MGSHVFFFFFFFSLVTGPRRSLSLNLSDTKVYEPQIRARRLGGISLGVRVRCVRRFSQRRTLLPAAPKHRFQSIALHIDAGFYEYAALPEVLNEHGTYETVVRTFLPAAPAHQVRSRSDALASFARLEQVPPRRACQWFSEMAADLIQPAPHVSACRTMGAYLVKPRLSIVCTRQRPLLQILFRRSY